MRAKDPSESSLATPSSGTGDALVFDEQEDLVRNLGRAA